jgi:hypothetical protein
MSYDEILTSVVGNFGNGKAGVQLEKIDHALD